MCRRRSCRSEYQPGEPSAPGPLTHSRCRDPGRRWSGARSGSAHRLRAWPLQLSAWTGRHTVRPRVGSMLHRREGVVGPPVIAMHPLGLDSSAFEGFGEVLARRGLRTVAVDLPGFGRSPLPDRPLTAPDAFRGVIAIAPYLPWLRFRFVLGWTSLVDARAAGWLPLERVWPVLRWLAGALETLPCLREDELAQ